jgi:hypothetical protein
MCEIVVCVKNKGTSGDVAKDSKAWQQGFVIEVQEDGFDWGPAVLGQDIPGNPNGKHQIWRLFKLPNVTVAQASVMLAAEPETDPQNPSPYRQRRWRYFDKTKIPAGAFTTYWDDDTRAAPFITLPYSAAQLQTIVSTVDPIPFVGGAANVHS